MKKQNKVLVVDGRSLLIESYHESCPDELIKEQDSNKRVKLFSLLEKNSEGQYIGAIRIFLTRLFDCVDKLNPTHICVVWGVSRDKNIKKEVYAEYKSEDENFDEPLIQQFNHIKVILSGMVKQYASNKYEAIDLAGTIADKLVSNNTEINIVARSNNFIQLCDIANVYIKTSKASELYEEYNLDKEKEPSGFFKFTKELAYKIKGVTPEGMKMLRALVGVSYSNIPGVKGVGKVTALPLVKKFSTMENLYNCIDNYSVNKLSTLWLELGIRNPYNKLVSNRNNAMLSDKLLTINKNVYIDDKELLDSKSIISKKIVYSKLRCIGLLSKIALEKDFLLDKSNDNLKSMVEGATLGGIIIPSNIAINLDTVDFDTNSNNTESEEDIYRSDCYTITFPGDSISIDLDEETLCEEEYIVNSKREDIFDKQKLSFEETMLSSESSTIELISCYELKIYNCRCCNTKFTIMGSKEVNFCVNCGTSQSTKVDVLEDTGCSLGSIKKHI